MKKLKEKYYDRINKTEIEINVNAKISHLFEDERLKNNFLEDKEIEKLPKRQQEMYLQEQSEKSYLELDKMMDNGFQPSELGTFEEELRLRDWEKKYLKSNDYRRFVKNLQTEIKNTMNIMPEKIRVVMYFRFFKNMSISQIAKILHLSKSTAQDYISKGCGYLKYFLDKDIKKQDKIERERRMKFEQRKAQQRKNFFN